MFSAHNTHFFSQWKKNHKKIPQNSLFNSLHVFVTRIHSVHFFSLKYNSLCPRLCLIFHISNITERFIINTWVTLRIYEGPFKCIWDLKGFRIYNDKSVIHLGPLRVSIFQSDPHLYPASSEHAWKIVFSRGHRGLKRKKQHFSSSYPVTFRIDINSRTKILNQEKSNKCSRPRKANKLALITVSWEPQRLTSPWSKTLHEEKSPWKTIGGS